MLDKYKKYEPIFESWYLVRQLGEGSFGSVYEIKRNDYGTEIKSALKIISLPKNEDEIKTRMAAGSDPDSISEYYEEILKDIVNEFEIMSKLRGNSNIVSYEDHKIIPHEDGIGYDILIRMELLTPIIDKMLENKLSEGEIVKLGIDMCSALELCQKRNIIHRDIKPQNIFVSESGDYKLGDFGIARSMEKTTGGMSQKGTYNYMAPEVFRGDEYDSSVDIYSLGIVLYSMLNNNRGPFFPPAPEKITPQNEEAARKRRFSGESIAAPSDASPLLSHIVLKACNSNPESRYESASQMKRDLELYYDNYCIPEKDGGDINDGPPKDNPLPGGKTIDEDPMPGGPPTGGASAKNKFPMWVGAFIAVLAVVIITALSLALNEDDEPEGKHATFLKDTKYEFYVPYADDKTEDHSSENEKILESYNEIIRFVSGQKEKDENGYPVYDNSAFVKYGVADFNGDGLFDFFEYHYSMLEENNYIGAVSLTLPQDANDTELANTYYSFGRIGNEFEEDFLLFLDNGLFIDSWILDGTRYCRVNIFRKVDNDEWVYLGDKKTATKYFPDDVSCLVYHWDDPEEIARIEVGMDGNERKAESVISMKECSNELKELIGDGRVIVPVVKDYAEASKNNSEPEVLSVEDAVIGTWQSENGFGSRFTIEKGGVGTTDFYNPEKSDDGSYKPVASNQEESITWALKDGIVEIKSDKAHIGKTVFLYDPNEDVLWLDASELSSKYVRTEKADNSGDLGDAGSEFKVGRDYTIVEKDGLFIRDGASIEANKKGMNDLSKNGKAKAIEGKGENKGKALLKKGTEVTCLQVRTEGDREWIRIPSGWICGKEGDDYYIR